VAVRLDHRRRADEFHLQVAMRGLDARQRVDLVAHALPFGLREQPQAAAFERVVGDHEAIGRFPRHRVAMDRGNGHAALLVQGDGGFALKHSTKSHKKPLSPTLCRAMGRVKKNPGPKRAEKPNTDNHFADAARSLDQHDTRPKDKPFATSTTCRTYLQRRINKSAVALALGPLAKVSLPPKSARQSRCVRASRKVRAPQGRVPGNTWAARADGQCNRK